MEFPKVLYVQYADSPPSSKLDVFRTAETCEEEYPVAVYELKQVGRVKKDTVFVADPIRRLLEHGG